MDMIVQLNNEKFAIVDDFDFDLLWPYRWGYTNPRGNREYARAWVKGKSVYMHTLIMKKKHVDHIDGNGLNNTRRNLREATQSQNRMNSAKKVGTYSKYKGLSFNRRNNDFYVYLTKNYKKYWIGSFQNETEAAMAYDRAAIKLFGKYAKTNKALGLLK